MSLTSGLAATLRKRFDALLDDPQAYALCVARQSSLFPEGDLFPFTLPVTGYVNAAMRDPTETPNALTRVATLIAQAIPVVARHARVAADRLHELPDYREQSVYLGHLALALGSYRLIGGDRRWEAVHGRVCEVLHDALNSRGTMPLMSYPGISWPFDTMPCLLALRLRDLQEGTDRYSPAVRKHLEWIKSHGSDPHLRLPYSQIDPDTGAGTTAPRGCELPWRITLLAQLDRPSARDLYRTFAKHFWVERVLIAGFAEWPEGAEQRVDADSGPILWGIGLSATGFGLGAAIAAGDQLRLLRLRSQLFASTALFPALRPVIERMFPYGERYVTGMLMGDAAMFAMAGWCDWRCQMTDRAAERSSTR